MLSYRFNIKIPTIPTWKQIDLVHKEFIVMQMPDTLARYWHGNYSIKKSLQVLPDKNNTHFIVVDFNWHNWSCSEMAPTTNLFQSLLIYFRIHVFSTPYIFTFINSCFVCAFSSRRLGIVWSSFDVIVIRCCFSFICCYSYLLSCMRRLSFLKNWNNDKFNVQQ